MRTALIAREGFLVACTAASAAWLRWVQRRVPTGPARFLAAAPVVATFLLAPLLFDPVTETPALIASINLPWLSNTVVAAWALGRGPLAQPQLPFRAFLAFLAAPAQPATRAGRPTFSPSLLAAAAKVAFLCATARVLTCHAMPRWLEGALQSVALFLFTSLGMEGAATVGMLLSGGPVLAPFNRPYLSTSLSDFWSRRWNVVPGLRFRAALYDPICGLPPARQTAPGAAAAAGRAHGVAAPALWRRLLGLTAVFAASGAVHELAHWHIARRFSGWWMAFFCLQAPLLLLEAWLHTLCRQAGIRPPRILRTAVTLLLLHCLASRLFYPDVVASRAPAHLLEHWWPSALGPGICTPFGWSG